MSYLESDEEERGGEDHESSEVLSLTQWGSAIWTAFKNRMGPVIYYGWVPFVMIYAFNNLPGMTVAAVFGFQSGPIQMLQQQ